jgi:hypothetical protein
MEMWNLMLCIFEEGAMRRIVLGLLLLITINGCKNTVGPLENRRRPGPDPLLSIDEQKRYGSERYSIPEDNSLLFPNGYANRPSPSGR